MKADCQVKTGFVLLRKSRGLSAYNACQMLYAGLDSLVYT